MNVRNLNHFKITNVYQTRLIPKLLISSYKETNIIINNKLFVNLLNECDTLYITLCDSPLLLGFISNVMTV